MKDNAHQQAVPVVAPRSRKDRIRQAAAEALERSPAGMRATVLVQRIHESLPGVRPGTIRWGVHTLLTDPRPDVYRSRTGFYKASRYWRQEDD